MSVQLECSLFGSRVDNKTMPLALLQNHRRAASFVQLACNLAKLLV
jgi:hypothetical protein